jgi:hypothetical protein
LRNYCRKFFFRKVLLLLCRLFIKM